MTRQINKNIESTKAFKKAILVINSCLTAEQLDVAKNYVKRYEEVHAKLRCHFLHDLIKARIKILETPMGVQ